MRRTASFALLAVLAAGCGGGDNEAERAEFVARGNAICRQLARDFAKLGPPPPATSPRLATWELRVQVLAQRAFGRLRSLEPPEELRDEHEALVDGVELNRRHNRRLRAVARANATELRRGITDGPAQREYQDLTAAIRRDQIRTERRMRAVGWRECAKLTE